MSTLQHVTCPLRTLDPDAADESDLEVFREIVGDARVVCLGETAHYVAEFARLRDRLTRYLARELGFTALVLESGLPEGLLVDDWVRGGPGDLAWVANEGIGYAFGQCVGTRAQLRWMREWNATAETTIGFHGMDVPGWCRTPLPGVAACLRRLPAHPQDPELLALSDLGDPARTAFPDAAGPMDVPDELEPGIAELVERAETAGDDIAIRCAYGAQRVVEFRRHGLYPGPGRNLRNEVMTENLRWILGREQRIVVSAHNVHLQRARSFDGTATVGGLLQRHLGDHLVVIGTTRGAGVVPGLDLTAPPEGRFAAPAGDTGMVVPPAHALDAVLDDVHFPWHVLDLRRVPSHLLAGVTAMAGQHRVIHLDPQEAFDAIVHVREVTPARGSVEQKKERG